MIGLWLALYFTCATIESFSFALGLHQRSLERKMQQRSKIKMCGSGENCEAGTARSMENNIFSVFLSVYSFQCNTRRLYLTHLNIQFSELVMLFYYYYFLSISKSVSFNCREELYCTFEPTHERQWRCWTKTTKPMNNGDVSSRKRKSRHWWRSQGKTTTMAASVIVKDVQLSIMWRVKSIPWIGFEYSWSCLFSCYLNQTWTRVWTRDLKQI